MPNFTLKKNSHALVIVAHPDDETIWLGGTILKYPHVSWTILSLCRASDRYRAPKFFRVCKYFGAHGIMDDLDDEGTLSYVQSLPVITRLLTKHLRGQHYDYLFTHGRNGEYGHERHKGVHECVENLRRQKQLSADTVLYCNYKKKPGDIYHLVARKNSDWSVPLNAKIFKQKVAIMTDIYGFAPDGIDAGYCTKTESFKIV